jgi:hypothetical protein
MLFYRYRPTKDWVEFEPDDDEICPDCESSDIEAAYRLYACETVFYPAEYLSSFYCNQCGHHWND